MRCGQVVWRELPSIVLHYERRYTRDCVVQGCRFSAVMSGEDDKNDGLFRHP
jgi:hypothetical protein